VNDLSVVFPDLQGTTCKRNLFDSHGKPLAHRVSREMGSTEHVKKMGIGWGNPTKYPFFHFVVVVP